MMKRLVAIVMLLLFLQGFSQDKKNETDSIPPMLEVKKEGVTLSGITKINSLAGNGKRQVWVDENGVLGTGSSPQTEAVTYYQNVPASSFTKIVSNTTSTLYTYAHRVYMTAGATDGLVAPLNLPHGAVIKSMRIIFLDNSDYNIRVQLLRTEIAYGQTVVQQVETSGNSVYESSVTSPALNIPVNNELNFYSVGLVPYPLHTWAGSSLYIKAIVFTYEL
jgi:hypothetical protein